MNRTSENNHYQGVFNETTYLYTSITDGEAAVTSPRLLSVVRLLRLSFPKKSALMGKPLMPARQLNWRNPLLDSKRR